MSDASIIDAKALLDVLLQVREHHSAHPHNVSVALSYWYLGALTSLFVALIFKPESAAVARVFFRKRLWLALSALVGTLVGTGILWWGVFEHVNLHANMRGRLDAAVRAVVTADGAMDRDLFWETHGEAPSAPCGEAALALVYPCDETPVFLLNLEPDRRAGLADHDVKIFIGGIVFMASFLILLAAWVFTRPPRKHVRARPPFSLALRPRARHNPGP